MTKIITPQQLKDQHPLIFALFFENDFPQNLTSPTSSKNTRLPHESLHDYLIRKNIKCRSEERRVGKECRL